MRRVVLIIVVAVLSGLLTACGGVQEEAQEPATTEQQAPPPPMKKKDKEDKEVTTGDKLITIGKKEDQEDKVKFKAKIDEQLQCQGKLAVAGMSKEEAKAYQAQVKEEARTRVSKPPNEATSQEEFDERLPAFQQAQKQILAERGFTC